MFPLLKILYGHKFVKIHFGDKLEPILNFIFLFLEGYKHVNSLSILFSVFNHDFTSQNIFYPIRIPSFTKIL